MDSMGPIFEAVDRLQSSEGTSLSQARLDEQHVDSLPSEEQEDEVPTRPSERSNAMAIQFLLGLPCKHNTWDLVRSKNTKRVLVCRQCKIGWVGHLRLGPLKCPSFLQGCPLKNSCPLIHVHRRRTGPEDVVEYSETLNRISREVLEAHNSMTPAAAHDLILKLIQERNITISDVQELPRPVGPSRKESAPVAPPMRNQQRRSDPVLPQPYQLQQAPILQQQPQWVNSAPLFPQTMTATSHMSPAVSFAPQPTLLFPFQPAPGGMNTREAHFQFGQVTGLPGQQYLQMAGAPQPQTRVVHFLAPPYAQPFAPGLLLNPGSLLPVYTNPMS